MENKRQKTKGSAKEGIKTLFHTEEELLDGYFRTNSFQLRLDISSSVFTHCFFNDASIVKEAVSKDAAADIKAKLEAVGAKVTIK